MQVKVKNEAGFQILTSAMSIGPSQTGYVLEVSADGKNFSPLFAVAANTTKMATGLAPNAYYRLKGNVGEVIVNWSRSCVTEGGGSGTELQPVADFPLNAVEGTVISYTGSSSASGVYQYDGNEWTEVGADDLSAYWTSAQTQSAITAVEDHLFEVEEVTATALTELHDNILELSGRTVDLSPYYTSAQTEEAISAATAGKADASNITGGLQPVPTFGDTWFPVWNKQGIITGTSRKGYIPDSYFNGKKKVFVDTNGNGGVTIYGPESVGTAGDILVSTGNGAPIWSAMPAADVTKAYVDSAVTELQDQLDTIDEVIPAAIVDLNERVATISAATQDMVTSTDVRHMVKLSQAAYDQLSVKDPETFYIIVNE